MICTDKKAVLLQDLRGGGERGEGRVWLPNKANNGNGWPFPNNTRGKQERLLHLPKHMMGEHEKVQFAKNPFAESRMWVFFNLP